MDKAATPLASATSSTSAITTNSNGDQEEDLYNDLEITSVPIPKNDCSSATSSIKKRKKSPSSTNEFSFKTTSTRSMKSNNGLKSTSIKDECMEENIKLRNELRQLKDENATLRRNISTLYRTAKSEIARKDRIIESFSS
mmetsp:Transcript_14952/g.18183  ORF Transcript_14952/g.18183 Transcript_14952/m.18183 type:complete len:140 (-) Transcript_14952:158-577(-)